MAVLDFDESAYRQQLIAGGIAPVDAAEVAAKTAAAKRASKNGGEKACKMAEKSACGDPELKTTSELANDLFGGSSRLTVTSKTGPPPAAKSAEKEGSARPAPLARVPMFKPIKGELSQRQKTLIDDAMQIERDDARKAGATGYMARTLAQATLPHKDPKIPLGQLYSRDTGKLTMTVAPTSRRQGIPYGSIPRVILAWICTEAVRTKERTLSLGHSQSEFLGRLSLHNNGRDIARFRDQSLRLFKSVISVEYFDDENGDQSQRLLISDQSHVFWHPKKVDQAALWDSTLDLSKSFFDEIVSAPVPIDMAVYHALTKSPMAMDIYTWLTYRMFVLLRSGRPFVLVPWIGLKMQFGASYGDDQQGLYNFRLNFKTRLREVLNFYPEARDAVEDDKKSGCLKLYPCALHIAHKKTSSKITK